MVDPNSRDESVYRGKVPPQGLWPIVRMKLKVYLGSHVDIYMKVLATCVLMALLKVAKFYKRAGWP